jgi:U3 small nucleolar RNA-associated protein 21
VRIGNLFIYLFSDEGFFHQAKMLQPAALDLELRSLNSIQSLKAFMRALRRRLATHRDFEAVETMMNVFLHIHADVLIVNEELREGLEELEEVQKKESQSVLELITSSLGTLGFVRDTL